MHMLSSSDIMPSCWPIFNCLSFSPTPRRFQSSLYVWRLHQISSAFFSSPSNGCFSPPAPTYGSSTSGTQVSPSFLQSLFLSLPAKRPLSPPKTLCTRNFELPSFFSVRAERADFLCLSFSTFYVERGVCLPTVSLWILFVYIEAAIRFKDLKNFHVDLCRPFAAHW